MVYTKQEVLEIAKEKNVKFIRLQFTDIYGGFKNIAITVEELPKALEGKIMFDSSVIEGFVSNKEHDIYLKPDPNSFVVFPWRPREGAVARLICDVHNPDGSPYEGCSRYALKRAVAEARELDLELMVSPETEFFLLHTDKKGNPTTATHDRAGYCDLSPLDLGENTRRDMVLTLEQMGFEIRSSHHELAFGQHEISLKAKDALTIADNLVTFRLVVRTIAQRHGLHASFMPKPLKELSGSGLHIYQSLFKNDENILYQQDAPDGLSEAAGQYIAGILKHAKGFTAITNPIINSYKRIIPNDLSSVFIAWSQDSRNSIVRVPAERGEGTSIELRNPDPSCNPYLALAVILKSGLDGIKNKLQPSEQINDNMFQMGFSARQELGLECLPRNLEEALWAIKDDSVVRDALGEHIAKRYEGAKWDEWERFQTHVHPWELEEYLNIY